MTDTAVSPHLDGAPNHYLAEGAALLVRPAVRADLPAIEDLLKLQAASHAATFENETAMRGIERELFCEFPILACEVACVAEEVCAILLWRYSFSTFLGRRCIHIEDMIVREDRRLAGISIALAQRLADLCIAESIPRLEWSVLRNNAPPIAIGLSVQAEELSNWTSWRLEGKNLERFLRYSRKSAKSS